MKRANRQFALFLVAIFMFFGMAACGNQTEHIGISAKCPYFDNVEDMEDFSDVIIEGIRLTSESPSITTVNEYVVSAYTWSNIQITNVHKDSTGKLAIGDIITILENEAFDAESNATYHLEGYNMMVPERSYLLFLTAANMTDGSEYFVSSGINCGTVSLENDGRLQSYVNRSGSAISDFSIYESLWQEAKDKYVGE